MHAGGIVTLTTDFGLRDSYVAQMKGTILSIAIRVSIVDVTHAISRHSILQAAFLIADVWRTYPDGTAHVVVVDPGVGTERRPIALEAHGQYFVGPDNGVFSRIMQEAEQAGAGWTGVVLSNTDYWRTPAVSATFHGRDIFAPVAAHLVNGTFLTHLGDALTEPVRLHLPAFTTEGEGNGNAVTGEIIYVDSFGNCVTNIPASALPPPNSAPVSVTSGTLTLPYVQTYGIVTDGQPLALIGSHGYLELAARRGNAEAMYGFTVGTPVTVQLAPVRG